MPFYDVSHEYKLCKLLWYFLGGLWPFVAADCNKTKQYDEHLFGVWKKLPGQGNSDKPFWSTKQREAGHLSDYWSLSIIWPYKKADILSKNSKKLNKKRKEKQSINLIKKGVLSNVYRVTPITQVIFNLHTTQNKNSTHKLNDINPVYGWPTYDAMKWIVFQ